MPQLHIIELCINQLSLPESPFGLKQTGNSTSLLLIQGLSKSIASAKSLVDIFLHTPPGQEHYFPNIIWVMLHCGFSLAVRLDVQAQIPRIGFMTEHLRSFVDVAHTMRQVILRLESATSSDLDDRGDHDTFHHMCIRVKRIDQWYRRQQRHLETTERQEAATGSHLEDPVHGQSGSYVNNFEYPFDSSLFSQGSTPGAASSSPADLDYLFPTDAPQIGFPGDGFAFDNDTFYPFKNWL